VESTRADQFVSEAKLISERERVRKVLEMISL
jgi:hypothetical protein